MRLWRLTSTRHAATALSGQGAALFGGRWNPVGTRAVYAADSLALATLELAVHLPGADVTYVAIELDVPDRLIAALDDATLPDGWADDEPATQQLGAEWLARGRPMGLTVPSALVDQRSGERNIVLDPTHDRFDRVREVQRLDVRIDRRLTP